MPSNSAPRSALRDFLESEAAGGVLLIFAAILAMIVANSPFGEIYHHLIHAETGPALADKLGPMTVHLWINDGLMAVFFLLVGLEIKREFVDGRLSSWDQRRLPMIAAAAGMAVPAILYMIFAGGTPGLAAGWAIPAATDIAFAIGVLALLGSRVPRGLTVFLLTVAIADDVGSIIIIALFYSTAPPAVTLMVAGAAFALLVWLNRAGVTRISPYLLIGVVLWVAVLKSGVHATLAGVLLAMTVPFRVAPDVASPSQLLERDLHAPVAFGVLPLFAFANAGVSLHGLTLNDLAHPISLGIALGLFAGKQAGVMAVTALLVSLRVARLPQGATWPSFYGVAVLAGIGFTMSLFIGSLAFHEGLPAKLPVDERLGILLGSAMSAIAGYLILRAALKTSAYASRS